MRAIFFVVITIVFFGAAPANASIIYELNSQFASLTFEASSFVDKDRRTIDASQLTSCISHVGDCSSIYFDEIYGLDLLKVNLNLSGNAGASYNFYFPLNTFETIGVANTSYSPDASISISDTNPAAVPNPGTLALIGIGISGLWLSQRRKQ